MRSSQLSPLVIVCLALAALAALGVAEGAAPEEPAVAPTVRGSPVPVPAPARQPAGFLSAPRSMADVHRLRDQAAKATAADLGALRELALAEADPIVVGAALAAMGRLGALARDGQVAALQQDPRPRVRQEYVIALGLAADPLAIPPLQRIAAGTDVDLRPLALQSLGRIGAAAVPALTELQARGGWNEIEMACLHEALARARARSPGAMQAR